MDFGVEHFKILPQYALKSLSKNPKFDTLTTIFLKL